MALGSIEWPAPPTPCDEGTVYHAIITCNGMGEWIPDFIPPEETGGSVSEGRVAKLRAFGEPLKARCGCGTDPVALVKLGAELFKAGIEFGKSQRE